VGKIANRNGVDLKATKGAVPPAGGTTLPYANRAEAIAAQVARIEAELENIENYPNFKELLILHNNSSVGSAFAQYVEWENTDMVISGPAPVLNGPPVPKSIAAECIIFEKNKKNVDYRIGWGMTSYLEFDFRGVLANGKIEPNKI